MWLSKGSILGVMLVLLSACTEFRPLHMPTDQINPNIDLASIEVREVRSRSHQVLRNAVLARLNPAGLPIEPAYRLDLSLTRQRKSLAVQLDDRITRYDMIVTVTANLLALETGKLVYRTRVARTASYNVVREPFATLVAEQDAERRASIEIANQLRSLLALHFERAERENPI